jgi:hypothetical protein
MFYTFHFTLLQFLRFSIAWFYTFKLRRELPTGGGARRTIKTPFPTLFGSFFNHSLIFPYPHWSFRHTRTSTTFPPWSSPQIVNNLTTLPDLSATTLAIEWNTTCPNDCSRFHQSSKTCWASDSLDFAWDFREIQRRDIQDRLNHPKVCEIDFPLWSSEKL